MLDGKVALVAGAIRGIGRAVAVELARHGVRCVLPYYDWLDELDDLHRAMRAAGPDYLALPADLREEDEAARVVEAAVERFGRLDILVNNVERGGWPVVHGPYVPEQWDLEIRTTVTAKWALFRACLPHLKRREGAAVVNLSSIAGLVGRAGPAGLVFNDGYALANRAIRTLTETWAREGAPEVRVNELMLGFVETRHGPGTRGWGLLAEADREALLAHTLLGRTGRVEEVARMVRFLVAEATFVTGAVIRMDGGYLLGGEPARPWPRGVVAPGEPTFGGGVRPGGKE
ncbi:SDR family NAD(P)-dependent oxidoreductase [Dissulfurirhabdus thermomarina]|uniref:SDR family NAD(P)-dependent oxidoreductase n=1 Tax=Dissulfurirhabdus thermomarina TaxID=1765737 RepID=UPI002852EA51|nr:SDR family oxidoreductase [Dissulfurirhabdus thermomarina]